MPCKSITLQGDGDFQPLKQFRVLSVSAIFHHYARWHSVEDEGWTREYWKFLRRGMAWRIRPRTSGLSALRRRSGRRASGKRKAGRRAGVLPDVTPAEGWAETSRRGSPWLRTACWSCRVGGPFCEGAFAGRGRLRFAKWQDSKWTGPGWAGKGRDSMRREIHTVLISVDMCIYMLVCICICCTS